MKNKLKIRLEVWGSSVLMQVLEQDERFCHNGEGDHGEGNRKNFCSRIENFYIRSDHNPEIGDGYIYLRGNGFDKDFDIIIHKCSNENDAINLKTKILRALEDWAKNAPEFQEKEVPAPDPGGNVYIF